MLKSALNRHRLGKASMISRNHPEHRDLANRGRAGQDITGPPLVPHTLGKRVVTSPSHRASSSNKQPRREPWDLAPESLIRKARIQKISARKIQNKKHFSRKALTKRVTMSIDDVTKAVEQVKPHVMEYQPRPPSGETNDDAPANNWETSTRYIIIDPILRALGWDLSDPKQCVVEFRAVPKWKPRERSDLRVDYVLLNRRGEPEVAIEAKRIDLESDDELGVEQLAGYVLSLESVRVAAITNGQYWEIYSKDEYGEWIDRNDRPLGLHWHNTRETAQRLHEYLAKEKFWNNTAPVRR